jgi:2-dehydropantoate 2-reductase
MTPVPVAVLGLGGIGGMLVARTGALGVGTEGTVEAIAASGLTLVHAGTTTVTRPEVVAVKAYALEEALDRVDPSTLDGAVVLPLLNGLEHVDAIRARLGAGPIVAAGSIGSVEAFSPEPGFVVQRTAGATIAAASDVLGRRKLRARLAPLAVPGIEIEATDEEARVLWDKAARLAVLAAASIASAKPVGALRDDPVWRPRLEAALGEACAVAEADGVELDTRAQWEIVERLPDSLVPSAARDSSVGRPTELDAITGSVVRAARRLGIWTPMLDGLLADAARHS